MSIEAKTIMPRFGPTKMKILVCLSDGKVHTIKEICEACLPYQNADQSIREIRRRLREIGNYTIALAANVDSPNGMLSYQLVEYKPVTLSVINRAYSLAALKEMS